MESKLVLFFKKRSNILLSIFLSIFVLLTSFTITFWNLNTRVTKTKNVSAENAYGLTVNSSLIGPYSLSSGDIPFTITLKSSVYREKVIESFTYGFAADQLFAASSKASHSMQVNQEYTVNFKISRDYIIDHIYCRVRVIDYVTGIDIFNESCTIYARQNDILNGNPHLGDYWTSEVLAFKIVDSEIVPYRDILSLQDTLDFFAVDNYYRLDLKCIVFSFTSYSKSYGKAEISFEDEHNVFPLVEKDENDVIHLDLIVNMDDMPTISLQYKKGFYVNPKNLEMSSTYQSGYKPTNYFYFPVNKLTDIVDYKFNLRIEELGLNESTFLLTLDYDTTQRLIGRCYQSDYCVTGGVVA